MSKNDYGSEERMLQILTLVAQISILKKEERDESSITPINNYPNINRLFLQKIMNGEISLLIRDRRNLKTS